MRGDQIRLLGVRAYGYHGVLVDERRVGQDFVVDVTLGLDLTPAGHSDDLRSTVSYAEVAADVVAQITGQPVDLIETLAERIAADALVHRLVREVQVVVHKPHAPVGVDFGDVQVAITRRKSVPVVIAVGANLARVSAPPQSNVTGAGRTSDPDQTVREGLSRLRRIRGLRRVRASGLFVTTPVGGEQVAGQPDYVNAVAVAHTDLPPQVLLGRLHELEDRFGRTRAVRWGARTLDLDLIQYGTPGAADEVISDAPELTLPHPRAHQRGFVLVPWLHVDPDARLRDVGADQGQILAVRELVGTLDLSREQVRPLEGPL